MPALSPSAPDTAFTLDAIPPPTSLFPMPGGVRARGVRAVRQAAGGTLYASRRAKRPSLLAAGASGAAAGVAITVLLTSRGFGPSWLVGASAVGGAIGMAALMLAAGRVARAHDPESRGDPALSFSAHDASIVVGGWSIPIHQLLGVEIISGRLAPTDTSDAAGMAFTDICQVLIVYLDHAQRPYRRLSLVTESLRPKDLEMVLRAIGVRSIRCTAAQSEDERALRRRAALSSDLYCWPVFDSRAAGATNFVRTADCCPRCDYHIANIPPGSCPECGLDCRDVA